MKQFFRKRLSAFLLAMVMVVSLIPAASAASRADITYTLEAGKSINLDRDDFMDHFEEEYEDFYYLRFTDSENLDDCGYFTTYAYDKSDDEFTKVSLDERDITECYFFYYDRDAEDDDGDCTLDDLTFISDKSADGEIVTLKFTLYGEDTRDRVTGTLRIEIGDVDDEDEDDDSSADIVYEMEEDEGLNLDRDDFQKLFEKKYDDFSYLRFTDSKNLDDCGYFTSYMYDKDDEEFNKVSLDEDDITRCYFFYYDRDAEDGEDYTLDDLTFIADKDTDGEVVTLDFNLYGEDTSDRVTGTLRIEIGKVKNSSGTSSDKADIKYELEEGEKVSLDRDDFQKFFEDEYDDFSYLRFTDYKNLDDCGHFTSYAYDEDDEELFKVTLDEDNITKCYLYYYDRDVKDDGKSCTLDDLTFVADDDTNGEVVTLKFTLYGEDTSDRVTGTLSIQIGSTESASTSGDILYTAIYGNNIQINANDFSRFLKSKYPSSTLQTVRINGVPATGSLYYNYYGASAYGTSARLKLTASNCDDQNFYLSPGDASQYALTELTYVPGSVNYCATIPFTVYGTGSRSISGNVLISVTAAEVSEVYGVSPRNSAVSFPAPSLAAAVAVSTGSTPDSFQLLRLPDSSVGTIYVGTGTSRKATTDTLYGYSGGTWKMSQLRFVPASNYTGSVEIPYLAYNSNGTAYAAGKFCLGVVGSVKKFNDLTSTTWCYKYVAELSDAGVISGYSDGTYQPNNTVTYGAALKLIMLAAGYPEQAPTSNSSVFSGYLDRAKADGLLTGTVSLNKPITRLQVAQLAAKALKLDINSLSSVKPFTDTADLHVQALNAAGIVEGYFSNGTSTFKPGNTLTRGQVAAIVWRMRNYAG